MDNAQNDQRKVDRSHLT